MGDIELGDEVENRTLLVPPTPYQTKLRKVWIMNDPVVWFISAAFSLISTKRLLINGIHYPMHLLVAHILGTISLKVFCRMYSLVAGTEASPNKSNLPTLRLRLVDWCLLLLYTICVAGALVTGYRAMIDFENLPVLVMILTLDWQPDVTVDGPASRCSPVIALRNVLLIGGAAAIYLFDHRLTANAIFSSLIAAGLAGAARYLYLYRIQRSEYLESRYGTEVESLSGMGTITLVAALLAALGFLILWERRIYTPVNLESLKYTWFFNLCTSSLALESGGNVFRRLKEAHPPSCSPRSFRDLTSMRETALSILMVGLVSAGDSIVNIPAVTSFWQYGGYAAALMACQKWEGIMRFDTGVNQQMRNSWLSYTAVASKDSSETQPVTSRTSSGDVSERLQIGLLLLILLLAWPIALYWVVRIRSEDWTVGKPTLDASYSPSRAFEVVISRYGESATDLAYQLNSLITPNVMDLSPRIVIYDKANNTDQSQFVNELHAETGSRLEITMETRLNTGREGATYLDHIVSNWDSLASHTLFMQADVHFLHQLGPRIQDYFVPETGFLSLSPYHLCADCERCGDHSAWSEEGGILDDIYGRANGGEKCKDLVMTYRGQFIASAARIRGAEKTMYANLLEDLNNPDSMIHQPSYWDKPWRYDRPDSLNAPLFGYTLERMWGAIMQCSDARLAYVCPSLLSGLVNPMGRGSEESIADCQCLDRPL